MKAPLSTEQEIEGRCYECDCAFYYMIDPNDPVHRKLCDSCEDAGVIEP